VSQAVILKSFAELDTFFGSGAPNDQPEWETSDERGVGSTGASADLTSLLRELEAAGAALARIIVHDQEQRALAARDLERYDALVEQQREAEGAREQAGRIRREAESFAELAYADEARAEAARIAAIAGQAEQVATQQANCWRQEAEYLAKEVNLERLLAARRRQEESEKAKAAAVERAGRLAELLTGAKTALAVGQLAEARGLLALLCPEDSDNPEVASLTQIIAQRALAVKVAAAELAIQTARREYRRDPAGVASQLGALDLEGLPAELRRQVFGEWARACSRLCNQRGLVEPVRYAPYPGRGAVLARESADHPYVVVSALAMGPAWQEGETVDERQVRRARPLR
jgi:hypothetical protein